MALQIKYTTGYAGTGKSTALIRLVESLPLKETIVVAPTHKALHRLADSLPEGLEYKTIHALLGWIPTINEEAKTIEQIDSTMKLGRMISQYSHIVIDEAGMMSEEMLFEITSKIEDITRYDSSINITIHCFLDPYQLLPVRGIQIQTDPDTTTNLTTQYRSEAPDIVALYTKFVHYLQGKNKRDLTTPYSENVTKLDISQFRRGDRLLAYTNAAVGRWNQEIARQLNITSYENQEVQLGNMLETTLVSRVFRIEFKDIDTLMAKFFDGTLRLQNTQINPNFIESALLALVGNPHIDFVEDFSGTWYPVIIGIDRAKLAIQDAKVEALKDRKKFKEVYALGRSWIMDYAFATTVHKSQGSEFDRVFIDKADIQKSIKNKYYDTYARLMYVSISRAKKHIFI